MEKNGYKTLPRSHSCFVCGIDNSAGLKARFYVKEDRVCMPLEVQPHHCGYPEVVHGGVVAAALDECMAWAANRVLGLMCVTGRLSIRYMHQTPPNAGLEVQAKVKKSNRLLAYTEAVLVDGAGKIYAKAEASFMPLSAEQTLYVDDNMIYTGDEERVFDHLRENKAFSQSTAD